MPNFNIAYRHPFNEIQVLDQSASKSTSQPAYPLHMPIFPIRAAKGRETPYWCTGTQAIEEYGEETFDKYEKFYRSEQYYLTNAVFPNQPSWVMRMVSKDAKPASLVIEIQLTKDIGVIQYKRNDEGEFVLDENGDKIPELDEANEPIKEVGCSLKFTKRALTDEELKTENVKSQTYAIGDAEYTSYPFVMFVDKSKGAAGNRDGFQMYYDYSSQVDDIIDSVNALLYSFTPVTQPYNSNVPSVVKDIYNGNVNQMTLKPNTIDPYTERRLYVGDALARLYTNITTKVNMLPYTVKFFDDNIKLISETIAKYEVNNPELVDNPYMVNILSLTDEYDKPYYHTVLDETGNDFIQMNSLFTHYLEGGEDGDLSDEAFEDAWRNVMRLVKYPELVNNYRFPITHLYDIGYSINTSYAMLDFMAKQKRCKVVLAAQDINRHLYSMDEAASLGAALRARAAITPESVYYGTSAMRATIFGQSGYVNDTTIKTIIPATYWSAERRSMYHGGTSMQGTWSKWPSNMIDIYREFNFIPDTPDQREVLWDGATNYFQAATMTQNFFPSIRSIYKDQSSILSDDEFTDACVYLMAICDRVWVYHVGRKDVPFAKLKSDIETDIVRLSYIAFGDTYTVDATVYVTEGDVERKDSLHIDTVLTGFRPYRRWYNTIITRGEDPTPTASAEI